MGSLEEIGALLGFVAFVGLAVLVFLTFQQARHLRRLRDWAGRSPERAAAAAGVEPVGEQTEVHAAPEDLAADLPEGEAPPVVPPAPREPRFAAQRAALSEWWSEIDRRMPVEPKLLFGGLAAIILGVGIATGGFGLTGSDDPSPGVETSKGSKKEDGGGATNLEKEKKAKVAVLNGTAPEPGVPGVPGIADRASGDVKSAGFKIGAVTNAGSYTASVIMFAPGAEKDAEKLAEAVSSLLGTTNVVPITPDIEAVAGGADVALIIGQDDAAI